MSTTWVSVTLCFALDGEDWKPQIQLIMLSVMSALSVPLIIFFYFICSEEEAKFGARRLARSLQKLGFQVTFSKNMHTTHVQGFNFIKLKSLID